MPPKKRSTLELERLRLERRRQKQKDREYARKKYPACPDCHHHHPPKAHPSSVQKVTATAGTATNSVNDSEEKDSTDTVKESPGQKASEESNLTQKDINEET